MNYRAGIVRILQTESNKTVGTGFVASDTLVVTCAHVVKDALGKDGDSVSISFYNATYPEEAQQIAIVDLDAWSPPDQQDIAVLRLDGPLPDGVEPLVLGSSPVYPGHKFESFGFPSVAGHDELPVEGDIVGRIQGEGGHGLLVLSSDNILKGMSGAPVWDTVSQRVVGMINGFPVWTDQERRDKRKIAGDRFGRGKELNFGPTSETIRALCSKLHISDRNPYMGLRTFSEENADLFFGREAYINELVEKLRNGAQFLAIVGASGSGKSSLVYAGLLPQLRSGEKIPGSDKWGYVHFRPGSDPYAALAAEGLVEDRSGGLKEAIEEYLTSNPDLDHLLLFADQFEELFALCDEATRKRFLDEWAGLVGRTPKLTLLLTMQAGSYYGEALKHAGLGKLLSRSELKVLPMNEEDLREAVSLPAQELGLRFETGLVQDIVEEASKVSHPLPLLQESLSTLWELEKEGGALPLLTHDTFREQVGGVGGAIGRRATEFYNSLSEREQATARHVFTRLVHIGEGGQDNTLQQNQMEALVTRSHSFGEIQHVAWMLADERFLVLGDEANPTSQPVRIVHQVLLDEWDRLSQWIREREDFLRWLQRFDQRMLEWESRGFDNNLLLRGPLLVEAVGWRASNAGDLRDEQIEYINRSTVAQTQTERRRRLLTAVAGLAAIIMFALAVFASNRATEASNQSATAEANNRALATEVGIRSTAEAGALSAQGIAQGEKNRAESNAEALATEVAVRTTAEAQARAEEDRANQLARDTLSRLLATDAREIAEDDFVLALLLALQADDFSQTALAQTTLFELLNESDRVVRLDKVRIAYPDGNIPPQFIDDVVAIPDRNLLITAGTRGSLRAWDLDTFDHVFDVPIDIPQIGCLALSPDQSLLAICQGDTSEMYIWDFDEESIVQHFVYETDLMDPQYGAFFTAAFTPDGKKVAMAGLSNNNVLVWNVDDGNLWLTLSGHTFDIYDIAIRSDGRHLASASHDNTVIIWDLNTGQLVRRLLGHRLPVNSVAYSPDQSMLVTGDQHGNVLLWDGQSYELIGELDRLDQSEVSTFTFSPDSKLLAQGNAQGIFLRRVPEGEVVAALNDVHESFVRRIIISADGKTMISGGADGKFAKWDLYNRSPLATDLVGHEGDVWAAAISPDNNLAVTGDVEGKIIVWDRSLPEVNGRFLTGHDSAVSSISFGSNGKVIASGGRDRLVKIWDVESGNQIGDSLSFDGFVGSVKFSLDGSYLAASTQRGLRTRVGDQTVLPEDSIGTITVFDTSTIEEPTEVFSRVLPSASTGLDIDLSDRWLAVSSNSAQVVQVFDLETGDVYRELDVQRSLFGSDVDETDRSAGEVGFPRFLPDGNSLVIPFIAVILDRGRLEAGIIVWDLERNQLRSRSFTNFFPVATVGVSPDGQYFYVAGCSDVEEGACSSPQIRILEADTLQDQAQLGSSYQIWSLAASPDGQFLLSAGSEGNVTLRNIAVSRWHELGCDIVGRNLMTSEWQLYVGLDAPYEATCSQYLPDTQDVTISTGVIESLALASLQDVNRTSNGAVENSDGGEDGDEVSADVEVIPTSLPLPSQQPEQTSTIVKTGDYTTEMVNLPSGLELELPAIIQCRETGDSSVFTNEFLAAWLFTETRDGETFATALADISLVSSSGDNESIYGTTYLVMNHGTHDWLMSERNFNRYAMTNSDDQPPVFRLHFGQVEWIPSEAFPDQPDDLPLVTVTNYHSIGSPLYPQHRLGLRVNQKDTYSVHPFAIVTDREGNGVDILVREGARDGFSDVAWISEDVFLTYLSSLSVSGRCVGPTNENGYVLHLLLAHQEKATGRRFTQYLTWDLPPD